MTDVEGRQLEERSHISWAQWESGLAHFVRVLHDIFRQSDPEALAATVGSARGIASRRAEIKATIPIEWLALLAQPHHTPGDVRRLGQFSPLGIPLLIAGRLLDSSVTYFVINDDGTRLRQHTTASELPSLPWQRVRIVVLRGKEWHVDPY